MLYLAVIYRHVIIFKLESTSRNLLKFWWFLKLKSIASPWTWGYVTCWWVEYSDMKDCRYTDIWLYCICKMYVHINVISWIMLTIWIVNCVLTYGFHRMWWFFLPGFLYIIVKKDILCYHVFIVYLISKFSFFVYMNFF